MAEGIALDPGSRIPDPPLIEEDVLQWAADLTKKLRNDHADNVDRVENLIMADYRTNKRPDATGSKRMFHDEYSGVVYLDSKDNRGNPVWLPLNAAVEWSEERQGVNVIYSTSLPVAGIQTGFFIWDEEVWDEDSYWPGSGNTITIPETRTGNKSYQVQVYVSLSALASGEEIIISGVVEGDDLTSSTNMHVVWRSDGNAKKLRLNFVRDLIESDELQIGYTATATFTLDDMYTIVTPVTASTGGGGYIAPPAGITSHADLSGLLDDDHTQYILGDRADWTDLTDTGVTELHTHAEWDTTMQGHGNLLMDNNFSISWLSSIDDIIKLLSMNASDQITVGNIAYETFVGGDPLHILGTSGGINIETVNASNGVITIDSDDDVVIFGDSIILTPLNSSENVFIDTHGSFISGKQSGGGETEMLGMSTSPANRVQLCDGSANAWLNTDTLFVGLSTGVASAVYWYVGSSSFVKLIDWNATKFTIGNSNYQVDLDATILNCSGSDQVRLPYLGAIPSPVANGDIWMESDGLHIYYGGAEKIVAGV